MKKTFCLLASLLMLATISLAQLNLSLLGTRSYNQDLSDIWGYTGSGGNNNEYAIVGVYDGVSVVDVTDPTNPTEVYFISGPNTIWRDMKTWNNHAYITNEASGGLLIIDLSTLPATGPPPTAYYTGNNYPFSSAHNIYIDENGVAYIFGADYSSGGAIMLDLTVDPMAPVELGVVDNFYLHDGMVRGDTLWGGAVYAGYLAVIDVSNKSNPQVLATQNTPHGVSHNCWISDDGKTVFTTDETSGAYLVAYDVSDVTNISELDRIQSNPGSGVIPHNTHFMNNFLITSYYRDGITIHDVMVPGNMVEVGNYDTYTQGSGDGFNGAWGVYPWLPSGNIIVSDIENGLLVLGPDYVRGCYIEGQVTDSLSGTPISGATITILGPGENTTSDISGNYQMGIADSGTYTVVFSAPGYADDTMVVTLVNGVITVLNAELYSPQSFTLNGQVVESTTGDPVANAHVIIQNGASTFNTTADGSGNFNVPSFIEGTYEVVAGQWGYVTSCNSQSILSTGGTLVIPLDEGIYDDFSFDFNWTVTGNASTGIWVREEPNGTTYNGSPSNPSEDVSSDCLGLAYVTGNNAGGGVGNDDVDNGNTVLTSPVFDLSSYADPLIEYHYWFFNDGGSGGPDDSLKVSITNGSTTALVDVFTDPAGNSSWTFSSFTVSDYITPTATMQFIVETFDLGNGHLVEGGLDLFRVQEGCTAAASFSASSMTGCVGDTLVFTSTSPGGTSFSWWVDNINTGTGTSLSTQFTNPGPYAVTLVVSDSSCADSATLTVQITAPPSLSNSVNGPSCPGGCDGDAMVTPSGGQAPYGYTWNTSPSQSNAVATGLCAGVYQVTVVDANGCIAGDVVTLVDPNGMSGSSGSMDASCGLPDGYGYVSVTGGTMPYSYMWDDPLAQTTDTAFGLVAGIYGVTVTDGNGCTIQVSNISVGNINGPTASLSGVDVSCHGGSDGEITVNATGGTVPYTYLWDDAMGQTNSTATGLFAGAYSVTVTDQSGCIVVVSDLVTEPTELSGLVSSTNATCGLADGTASVSVAGGVSPYSYLWNDPNAQTTSMATGLLAGSYQVSVTDDNGCLLVEGANVGSNGDPELVISSSDVSCYGNNDGVGVSSVSNGTSPFTYLWNDANAQTNATATGLGPGSYSLTVTDAFGCIATDTCTITEPDSLGLVLSVTDASFGVCTGEATAAASGGLPPYSYLWSSGQSTESLVDLCPGVYTVAVTDANGCTREGIAVIDELVGIEGIDEVSALQIFPNPSNGLFNLVFPQLAQESPSIMVNDILGQTVYSNTELGHNGAGEVTIDLSTYPKGIYQLRMVTDRIIIVRSIVIH